MAFRVKSGLERLPGNVSKNKMDIINEFKYSC